MKWKNKGKRGEEEAYKEEEHIRRQGKRKRAKNGKGK